MVENVLLNNNAPPGWVAMSTLCILVHDVQKKLYLFWIICEYHCFFSLGLLPQTLAGNGSTVTSYPVRTSGYNSFRNIGNLRRPGWREKSSCIFTWETVRFSCTGTGKSNLLEVE